MFSAEIGTKVKVLVAKKWWELLPVYILVNYIVSLSLVHSLLLTIKHILTLCTT